MQEYRYEPVHGEGRVRRGLRLLGASWRYLREEPRLLVLPAVSTVFMVMSVVLVFLPALWVTRELPSGLSIVAAAVVASVPFTFGSTFFNVAFLSMVQARLAGDEPDVPAALRFAGSRWWTIATWTALATLVGATLSALQLLPVVGEWLGRLLSFVGGLAWGLATFFVVPVMVVEETGARESIRRSARTVRSRWGEAVTADLTTGVAGGVLAIPGFILVGAGAATYPTDAEIGAALVTAGTLVIAAVFTVSGAVTVLFQLLVYRQTVTGEVVGPFSEHDLATAMKPRRRWLG